MAVLNNQIDTILGVYDLEQFHDIGVVKTGKNINFSVDSHELTLSGQQFLLIGLDGHIIIGLFMGALLYDSKVPFTNNHIVIELLVYGKDWVFPLLFSIFNDLLECKSR